MEEKKFWIIIWKKRLCGEERGFKSYRAISLVFTHFFSSQDMPKKNFKIDKAQ